MYTVKAKKDGITYVLLEQGTLAEATDVALENLKEYYAFEIEELRSSETEQRETQ